MCQGVRGSIAKGSSKVSPRNIGAGRLVYYEYHETADSAAKRERLMKRWRRDWKIALIESSDPARHDLFDDAMREDGYEW